MWDRVEIVDILKLVGLFILTVMAWDHLFLFYLNIDIILLVVEKLKALKICKFDFYYTKLFV